MKTGIEGIRKQSATYPKVQNLMHNVNAQNLIKAHRKQNPRKAKGVDGVDKKTYSQNARESIELLIEKMRKFQYRPQPVRRTYIPKANGKMRPLGIPAYEDRLVQTVMADLLNEVYEPRFLDCSYGFREGRSAHDAVRYINRVVMSKKVNYILDADIKGFFDNVDHKRLMKFLEHDIQDKNFLRYIKRFLLAGISEDGKVTRPDRGTIQGGQISPVLANVYLHYVLDLWVERVVKPRLNGEIHYLRYADDFLLIFQYEDEAQKVKEALKKRLAKFGLELSEEKTRILPFGRYKGTKEDFDFLGFTFYNAKTREGKYRLGVRTSKKKLKQKRQDAKAWIKENRHKPISYIMRMVAVSLRGHNNYYGVNRNSRWVLQYYRYVRHITLKYLNRRSQKGHITWEKFNRIWDYYVPNPTVAVDIWDGWKPKNA